jgi:hypothetical protein
MSSPVLEKSTCQALLLLFLHTNHARNHVPYNRWSMSVIKPNLFHYHMPSLYHSHVEVLYILYGFGSSEITNLGSK